MIRQYSASAATSATSPTVGPSSRSAKVAEVFLTAGHAFQKLGDLALRLHSTATVDDLDENKWTEKDVDHLKDALTKFAHELDNISESVNTRTAKLIKNDIKRHTITLSSLSDPILRTPSHARTTTTTFGTAGSLANGSGQLLSAGTKRPVQLLSGGGGGPSTSYTGGGGPQQTKRFASQTGYVQSGATQFRPVSSVSAVRSGTPVGAGSGAAAAGTTTVTLQPTAGGRHRVVAMTPGTGVPGGSSSQPSVVSSASGGQRPPVGSGFGGAPQRRVNASQFLGSPNSSSGGAAGGGQPPPPQLQPQFPSGSGN